MWRRRLRYRSPRWVHAVAIVLLGTIVASVGYAQYQLHVIASSIDAADAGNKATLLARGISHAMNANAVAVVATIIAVVVLAVGAWIARRHPEGGPIAQLRR